MGNQDRTPVRRFGIKRVLKYCVAVVPLTLICLNTAEPAFAQDCPTAVEQGTASEEAMDAALKRRDYATYCRLFPEYIRLREIVIREWQACLNTVAPAYRKQFFQIMSAVKAAHPKFLREQVRKCKR